MTASSNAGSFRSPMAAAEAARTCQFLSQVPWG